MFPNIKPDDFEQRTFTVHEIRASGENEPLRLSGYAAVFNALSDDLGGFYERIQPGAFTKTLTESDVRALLNHNTGIVLGRQSSGTLRLQEDNKGLAFELDLPDTQQARDLVVSVKRGDIDQMSFGFRTIRDRWEQVGDQIVRTLIEVRLFEISPVAFPAYPQTSASVRSKFSEFQQSISAPGQAAHPGEAGKVQAKARLSNLRRQLDLAEKS